MHRRANRDRHQAPRTWKTISGKSSFVQGGSLDLPVQCSGKPTHTAAIPENGRTCKHTKTGKSSPRCDLVVKRRSRKFFEQFHSKRHRDWGNSTVSKNKTRVATRSRTKQKTKNKLKRLNKRSTRASLQVYLA